MYSKIWSRGIAAAAVLMLLPLLSMAQISIGVSVNIAPPELPVYVQPPIPADGYMWTPGYWAWDPDIQDYYWVPGTWIEPPQVGFLWTPGYWGWVNGAYVWNAGYWGQHIGFYGGVNYGYGYGGHGYDGGYWQDGHLFYNREVVNVGSAHITNVYNKTVINNVSVTRVSYNGGSGGVSARPSAEESAATHEHHAELTSAQRQHVQAARGNPELRASTNRGNPPIAATARPANFSGSGVVAAKHAQPTNLARVNPDSHAPAPRPTTELRPAVQPRPTLESRAVAPAPYYRAPAAVTPPREPSQPRPPAAVEPHAKPEQTQPARPTTAAQPHLQPQPKQPPRPAEHPEDHEHHQP